MSIWSSMSSSKRIFFFFFLFLLAPLYEESMFEKE